MGKRKAALLMTAILTLTSVCPGGAVFAEDAITTEPAMEAVAEEVSADADPAVMDDLDIEADTAAENAVAAEDSAVDVVEDMTDSTDDAVSGLENTEELASEYGSESSLIDEIEIVEETPVLAMSNTEGTLQTGVSEIITFNDADEEKVYTYTPEEDGFYSLMVDNISADNDNFEISLNFTRPLLSLTTPMLGNRPEIFFLQGEQSYEFRLSAYNANEQNPVICNFTFDKIPSIVSIEPVNGSVLEYVENVHDRYYDYRYGDKIEEFLETIKLHVSYSDGADSQTIPLLGTDSYGYRFAVSDENLSNPLWNGYAWKDVFSLVSSEGYQIPITYDCTVPETSNMVRTTVTLKKKTIQDVAEGHIISANNPLVVDNAVYGACAAFTAEEGGKYTFTCMSGKGMLIFDQDNKCIASSNYYGDDEEADSGSQSIQLQLSSGKTYYVAVPAPGEDGTVNVTVRGNQIGSVSVTSETGGSWDISDVCKNMKDIVLEINYTDGRTETIHDWKLDDDWEEYEDGLSYIFSSTEFDPVRIYLVNESGKKMNFISCPVPAGSYHIEVLINETEIELLNAPVITVEENYANAQAVSVGDSIPLNIPVGEYAAFSFKPEQEGYYTIYVKNNVDESSDNRDYDDPGIFWFENGVLREQYGRGNFNTYSQFFKPDTVFYFLMTGSLTDPITNTVLQILPTRTVSGAEVVTPLNKAVYRKGADNEIPISDIVVRLTYQSGDPSVLNYHNDTDIYGNRLYFAMYKDKSGMPDYDSEVDYDSDDYDEGSVIDNLDIGIYWLCIDVLKVQGDNISIPPIQITVTDKESVPQPEPQPETQPGTQPSVPSTPAPLQLRLILRHRLWILC